MILCLNTRKVLTYTKHASRFFKNNQIIIASPPPIITLTQEITMDERFNMIGLKSKNGRK